MRPRRRARSWWATSSLRARPRCVVRTGGYRRAHRLRLCAGVYFSACVTAFSLRALISYAPMPAWACVAEFTPLCVLIAHLAYIGRVGHHSGPWRRRAHDGGYAAGQCSRGSQAASFAARRCVSLLSPCGATAFETPVPSSLVVGAVYSCSICAGEAAPKALSHILRLRIYLP